MELINIKQQQVGTLLESKYLKEVKPEMDIPVRTHINLLFRIPNFRYYAVIHNGFVIGYLNGFGEISMKYWYLLEIYALPSKRRYLKMVLSTLDSTLLKQGFKGYIFNPEPAVKRMVDKHNIAKEMKWDS